MRSLKINLRMVLRALNAAHWFIAGSLFAVFFPFVVVWAYWGNNQIEWVWEL